MYSGSLMRKFFPLPPSILNGGVTFIFYKHHLAGFGEGQNLFYPALIFLERVEHVNLSHSVIKLSKNQQINNFQIAFSLEMKLYEFQQYFIFNSNFSLDVQNNTSLIKSKVAKRRRCPNSPRNLHKKHQTCQKELQKDRQTKIRNYFLLQYGYSHQTNSPIPDD